jgi:Ser/Thr protein kinase RdoA (MazF antagonist)
VTGALDGLAEFELGELLTEPALAARGAQGVIWKVQTATGDYAVKQLQPWVDTTPVPLDIAFQHAARDAGVPLPAPVLTPDGVALVDRLRVYEWVDLAPELRAPVSVDRAAEAGDLLGRIHRLAIPAHGQTGAWYLVPPSEEQWRQVIADARARKVASHWLDVVDADISFLLDVGRRFTVTPTAEPITCHADFWPANVLPSAEDDRLVVLDWENAGPLTTAAELAGALVDWTSSREGDVDLDAARALLVAYGDDATPIEESSFAMWVVTALNYLQVLLEHLVYDFEGSDPDFAAATLPLMSPDRLRAALRSIDVLVRARGAR